MSGLIIGALVSAYVVGIVPTWVAATRWLAIEVAYCHQEPRFGSAYKWDRPACARYDKPGCWRPDSEPGIRHLLKAAPAAAIWPIALTGYGVLKSAGSTTP